MIQEETVSARPLWCRLRWLCWLFALSLIAVGLIAWLKSDHRAVRKLEAAGFHCLTSEGPLAAISEDWRAAFRRETWGGRELWLKAPNSSELIRFKGLIHRLRPMGLEVDRGGSAFEDLDSLRGFTSLQQLYLNNCPALVNVSALKELTGLQKLGFMYCPELEDVEAIKGLVGLREIRLYRCTSLKNVDSFKGLVELRVLDLHGCSALKNVDGLMGLPHLQWLRLSECTALENIDGLNGLVDMQQIYLNGCSTLSLATLRKLSSVLPNTRITFPDGTQTPPPFR